MTDPPVYRLNDPSDLAQIPAVLLGFEPNESFVVMCLRGSGERTSLGMIMRYDLDVVDSCTDEFLTEVPMRCAADKTVVGVIAVIYAKDYDRYASVVYQLSDVLPVLEAVWVHNGHFSSYLCDDIDCCPDDGKPLEVSGAILGVQAEMTLAGVTHATSRAEIEASFTPGEPDAACQAIADTLLDVYVRDQVMIEVMKGGDLLGAAEHWGMVARGSTGPARDEALTVTCTFHYLQGDGTRANCALDAMTSNTAFGDLLLHSLTMGLPPEILREALIRAAEMD